MTSHSILQKDVYRHQGKWVKFPYFSTFFNPGLRFIYHLRAAQKWGKKNPFGLLHWFILRKLQIKFGYQISAKTTIGEGFYLGHWGAIVINPAAKIGKNCNIAQGVTIGQTNRGKTKGVPIIGDEVWIGANAVIVGGITIENNVLIAPNAYVNVDVPSNSVVIGNPAEIISKSDATDSYINNKI